MSTNTFMRHLSMNTRIAMTMATMITSMSPCHQRHTATFIATTLSGTRTSMCLTSTMVTSIEAMTC